MKNCGCFGKDFCQNTNTWLQQRHSKKWFSASDPRRRCKMVDQNLNTSPESSSTSTAPSLLVELVREIEQTPEEHWSSLLHTMRLFRQRLQLANTSPEAAWTNALNSAKTSNSDRQHALSELLNSWMEEQTGEEQKESWEFLQQSLDEDRLSNRPFFPWAASFF